MFSAVGIPGIHAGEDVKLTANKEFSERAEGESAGT